MSNVRKIETTPVKAQELPLRYKREFFNKPTECTFTNYSQIADITVKDALNTVQNIRRDFKNSFPSSTQPESTKGQLINFVKVDEAFVNLTRNMKLPNECTLLSNETKKRSFKLYSTNFKAKYTQYDITGVNFTPKENKMLGDPALRPGLPSIKMNYDNKEYLNIKRLAPILEVEEPLKKSKMDECTNPNKMQESMNSFKTFEFPHANDSRNSHTKEEKTPTVCNSYFTNQQNIHLNMNVTNIFIGKKNKDIFLLEDIKQLLLQTHNKYQEIHDSLTKKTLSFSIQNQSKIITQFVLIINKDTQKIEKYEKILNDGKKSSIDCTMGEDEEKMVSDQLESIKFELKKKISQL